MVRRLFKVERWRIVTHLRAFKGNGLANFEFEFRFGFPRHSRDARREVEEILEGCFVDEPEGRGMAEPHPWEMS